MCRLQKQTTFRKTKRRLNIRGRKLKMKMKIHGFILFLLFCEFRSQPYPDKLKSSQQIFDASKDSNQETNTIKIGIILDTRSWVGEVVQSCLTMAISEFYMLNEQYKTRIALEPRDSRGEPFRSIASGKRFFFFCTYLFSRVRTCIVEGSCKKVEESP